MKYLDADKLKAEIERFSATEYGDNTLGDDVANGALNYVLEEIIPSLQRELQEEDLEKELKEYFSGWADSPDYGQALNSDGECVSTDEAIALARHFAEWGATHLNARKEE